MKKWTEQAACIGEDTDIFFDMYEENPDKRHIIDSLCMSCPVQRECFATGLSFRSWGVWGGAYLVDGDVDRTFNNHKSGSDWSDLWENLTMEKDVLY